MIPKPVKRDRANPKRKRTDAQRQKDLADVAGWLADGLGQSEILPKLLSLRPYVISRTQLVYDVNEIRRRWRAESIEKIDDLIAEEIAVIRATRRKAIVAWEESCRERTKSRMEVSKPSGSKPEGTPDRTTIETEKQCGDAAFLQVILKCNERICKMRGIDRERVAFGQDEDAPPLGVAVEPSEEFQKVFGLTIEQADERLRKQIEHEVRQQIAGAG